MVSEFEQHAAGLKHPSGRALTRMEAARRLWYDFIPRKGVALQHKCVQRMKDEQQVRQEQDCQAQNGKRFVELQHPSFLAAKLRLSHGHIRRTRLNEIQTQVLIAGQENAVEALRLQTFMDYNFRIPHVPRNETMKDDEIRRLEKLIRETSFRQDIA